MAAGALEPAAVRYVPLANPRAPLASPKGPDASHGAVPVTAKALTPVEAVREKVESVGPGMLPAAMQTPNTIE
jgi:hypothetical protein